MTIEETIVVSLATGIITGVLSGIISGIIVSRILAKIEKNKYLKRYWESFLFKSMEYSEVEIPHEMIHMLEPMGGIQSEFGQEIMKIYEITNPIPNFRKESTQEQTEVLESSLKALEILWNKKKDKKTLHNLDE